MRQTLTHMNAAIQQFSAFPVICHPMNQQQAAAHDDNDTSNEDNNCEHNNAANHSNAANIPYKCILSPKPHNLYELWNKYEHGIGGQKAAKDFSTHERG